MQIDDRLVQWQPIADEEKKKSAIDPRMVKWEPFVPEINADPTAGMSGVDKFLAGAGKAMTDTARGVGQFFGAVNRGDVAESRKLDAPLMKSGSAIAGNLLGNAAMLAPTAFIPGANTVTGAGMIGAVAGLAQPSVSTGETLVNTLGGGAGGMAGQWAANKIPGLVDRYASTQAAKAAAEEAASAQKFAAAQAGAKMGYVTPPADLNPGALSELASGLSGKIKTAQTASQRNQSITDVAARRALGLPDNAPLDVSTLNRIRDSAGKAYEAVSNVGTVVPTPAYTKALDDAVSPFTSQMRSFPGRKVPSIVDDIASLKTNAFDAGDAVQTIKVLRTEADKAYAANDKLAGKAYKQAAGALEDAIDSHLVQTGAPADLLKSFREARQTIAKTYTVQKALNDSTGSVSAPVLAGMLKNQKPLSGELLDVAKYAQAFPKATQMLKESPKQVSPLDYAVAGGSAITTGNIAPLAMLGIRPTVRSALLSQPVQRAAMVPGYAPSMASRALPGIVNNDIFRISAPAFGASGGLLGANWLQQN